MKEAEFQQQVIQFARLRGWRVAWFRPVRVQRRDGSVYHETPVGADGKGWPDLFLARRRKLAPGMYEKEIVVAELKVGKNKPTAEQVEWLDLIGGTRARTFVWRPEDWETIQEVLS